MQLAAWPQGDVVVVSRANPPANSMAYVRLSFGMSSLQNPRVVMRCVASSVTPTLSGWSVRLYQGPGNLRKLVKGRRGF